MVTGSSVRARGLKIGSVALVFNLLVLGGIYYWTQGIDEEKTDDAYTDGRAVQIAPQVSGRVTSLDVTDNQFVHRGEALFHIDPRQYINDSGQAQGILFSAEARLVSRRLGAEIAGTNFPAVLQAAKANLVSAKANLDQRQADFSRQKGLPKKATTRQDFDAAAAALQQGQAQVREMQARLVQAKPVKQNVRQSQAFHQTSQRSSLERSGRSQTGFPEFVLLNSKGAARRPDYRPPIRGWAICFHRAEDPVDRVFRGLGDCQL